MAFNSSNAKRSNSNDSDNQAWKAQGYLNLYLPSKDGARRKLAGIPLRDSKPNECAIRAWLEEDTSRVDIILDKLEIEYQPATQAEGAAFDLS